MQNISRRRQFGLALALVLATIVVSAGGLSSYRKIASFQPLGFDYEALASHWLVTGTASEDSALQQGDQILLVNGDGPGGVVDLRTALSRQDSSELVVMRDGTLVPLRHDLPPLRIDFAYLVLALTACVYLLIGFYTLMRDARAPTILFFIWCLASAAVYLMTVTAPFDALDRGFYLIEELARILLAPLTLHLFAVFPKPLADAGRLRRLVAFFYLPAAFLALVQADLIFFGGRLFFAGAVATTLPVLDQLELLHLVVFGIAAVALLAWRLIRTAEPEPQRQATWIAVGTAAGYVPFLALYVAPRLVGAAWPEVPATLAVLPLALVPLTFSYAILRYKLWDIGIVVRDTLSLSLTILLGVSGFALANLIVNRVIPDDLALGRNMMVFASGLMIAGLMVPTRRSVGRSLERLQYRDSLNRRRALVDFGSEIREERDLNRLAERLREEIFESLEIEPSNLLLPEGAGYRPLLSAEELPQRIISPAFDDAFWSTDVTPLSAISFADRDPSERRLFAAGYRYAFPLKVREERLGVFVTGYQIDGVPLSSDDLGLLRNLLDQTSMALENARLVDRVHQQFDEVIRLQRFNQSIIDSSPAGIAVLDDDDRILSANGAFAGIVGRSETSLEGTKLLDALPAGSVPHPAEGIREVRIGDAGEERYLQLSTAPITDPDEGGDRVLVTVDVTERVAMEHALEEQDRLAALGMLAAGVAHEVNTPITGISSYAQMLLADTAEGDPHYDLLKKVEKQTFRAARIVNNLLNFARKRSGERQSLDIVSLIGECLDLSTERLAKRDVELVWHAPAEPVEVFGNESELQQVFTNLILNGIDAMNLGGGRLTVEVEANSDWTTIAVEDTGSGIAPQELETIFQPFYSTKVAQGGTGLGLSISHDIVKRHHGEVRVTSVPGKGSRFVVELPRREIKGTEEAS